MIATNLNVILKDSLISSGYSGIKIYPINAYGESEAPFITWIEFPSIKDSEQYWMYESIITYNILDNDLSRVRDIALDIETFLNVGDDIDALKTAMIPQSPAFRLLWCRMIGGGMYAPLEREGFTSMDRMFQVGYVRV